MAYQITNVEWDSSFLGYPIGSLELPADYSETELHETLDAAKGRFRLTVINLMDNGPEELATPDAQCRCYDRKIVFKKPITPPIPPIDPHVKAYISPLCSRQLEQLAIASGAYSRFKKDLELSSQYERLYLTWINHAVRGDLADAVWTWREGAKIYGLMTLRVAKRINPETGKPEREARVGMLAVNNAQRRRGIGGALLDVCDFWSESLGIPTASISTQVENDAVCSLCDKKGYQKVNEESVYHYWSPGWHYDPHRGWQCNAKE